jgi:phage portal protein BeeE
MGIINWLFGSEIKSAVDMQVKATSRDISSMITSISAQIFPSWHVFKDVETYRIVDEVSSVVNKLAQTAASLPISAYQEDGQDLPPTNVVSRSLNNFSYYDRLKLFSFLYLSNEAFIYKQIIEFGPNKGLVHLEILHPNFMSVVLSMEFPTRIVGYIYRDPQVNFEVKFSPEEIIFIRGFNPEIDFYTRWRGISKIQLLAKRLTRLEANKANSVAQMQNGGVPGLLFDKSGDFDDIEKKGMRDTKLLAYFSNSENKGIPYTGAGDVTYTAIGSTLVDLDSAELALIDSKGIYNAYAISGEWMNIDSTVRSDVKEMIRQVYTTAIQPYTKLVEEALERDPDLGGAPGVTVAFDFSSVPELQQSLKEKMEGLSAAPVMIPNDILEATGADRDPDPKMNLPWIKSGYQPLDSFDEIPLVDNEPIN